jgi:hypothetical protein
MPNLKKNNYFFSFIEFNIVNIIKMDLYTSDIGAIQEGNMRTKSVMDRNQAIVQHNNDVGTQIASLQAQQKTGAETQGLLQATQQFWQGGKLPNEITALQEHLKTGGTLFSNPIQQAQKAATSALTTAQRIGTSTDIPAAGQALAEEAGSRLSGAVATGLKGLSGATAVATAGIDIYKDIQSISSGHGIAGDNWMSKTSNVLQIGGAIADVGGTVFPPLAVLGGVVDIAAGAFGEIGAAKDTVTQAVADAKLKAQNLQQQIVQPVQEAISTGRVS